MNMIRKNKYLFRIKMRKFVLLIAVIGLVAADLHPLSDEFIEQVNREATTWTVSCCIIILFLMSSSSK